MKSKFGGIVQRNSKAIIIISILSLPFMALFQNCGKVQSFAMTDVSAANANKNTTLNTNDLPLGNTSVDQTGSSPSGGGGAVSSSGDSSSGGNVSVDDPSGKEEEELEIEDAKSKCASLTNSSESNNINGSGAISNDYKSISGIRGKHVLSSANFNGNTQIDLINDAYGALIICGLDVKKLSNSGGSIILVSNSKIELIDGFSGHLIVLDGSGAKIRNSQAVVTKSPKK